MITILVGSTTFSVPKKLLCSWSDYFNAMFGGNFNEESLQQIRLKGIIDAKSFHLILKYIKGEIISILNYPIETIENLANAVDFLQVKAMIKPIENALYSEITISNWIKTMSMANNTSFTNLEQLAGGFGLLHFKSMQYEYIQNIQQLYWYLSHPYLNVDRELDVFIFGLNWVSKTEMGVDAVLIILGCLDLKRISMSDFEEMERLMLDYSDSLPQKIVQALCYCTNKQIELTESKIVEFENDICENSTPIIYKELINLVKESRRRLLRLTPIIPVCLVKVFKTKDVPHYVYTFEDNKLSKWLEIAETNLWGWNIASWGPTKLVFVCGEWGKGSGRFMKYVRVYDTFLKKWQFHKTKLPIRRHAGVAVIRDSLFILGGVGNFRLLLDSAIIYDLKNESYKPIAPLPSAVQCPAVCTYRDSVYVAISKKIYKFEDIEDIGRWTLVIETEMVIGIMRPLQNYIYCTQNYFVNVYRFRPNVDTQLTLITSTKNLPASICCVGEELIIFSMTLYDSDGLTVEVCGGHPQEEPRIIWSQSNPPAKFSNAANSCTLALNPPPLDVPSSNYALKYLANYHCQ